MDEERFFEYLTESDGSTRDITFTPSALVCVDKFLSSFLEAYPEGELFDQDGETVEISRSNVIGYMKNCSEGCIHGQLKSKTAFVSQVHIFFDWPEGEKVAIEISYFPIDLVSGFTSSIFMDNLNKWWKVLESEQVFVRYENASWDYYNPEGLGVFYHARKA